MLKLATAALGGGYVSGGLAQGGLGIVAPGGLRRHYLIILAVGVLHLILLWVLIQGIRPEALVRSRTTELQVQILSPNLGPREALAPPLDWTFDAPEMILVPQPQIVITPDQEAGEGIVGSAITQKLAPRLDPKHLNQLPELPRTMGAIIAALSVELRVLVRPDGSIAEAEIVRSAGEGGIDQLATETVKNSWRYLPASINGKPIEAWMTVIVRFAPF